MLGFFKRIWSKPRLLLLSGFISLVLGLSVEGALANFVMGLVCGLAMLYSGTLWASIGLHGLSSILVVLLLHAGYSSQSAEPTILALAVLSAVAGVWLLIGSSHSDS